MYYCAILDNDKYFMDNKYDYEIGDIITTDISLTKLANFYKFINNGTQIIIFKKINFDIHRFDIFNIDNSIILKKNNILVDNIIDLHDKYFLEYLIKCGLNINNFKNDLLIWASQIGYIDIVKLLLKIGADVFYNNCKAITVASKYGHEEIVGILYRSDYSHKIKEKCVILAVKYDNIFIVEYFKYRGYNLAYNDNFALRISIRYNNIGIAHYLSNYDHNCGKNVDIILGMCVQENNIEIYDTYLTFCNKISKNLICLLCQTENLNFFNSTYKNNNIDIDLLIKYSIIYDNIDIFEKIYDDNMTRDLYILICENNSIKIFNFIVKNDNRYLIYVDQLILATIRNDNVEIFRYLINNSGYLHKDEYLKFSVIFSSINIFIYILENFYQIKLNTKKKLIEICKSKNPDMLHKYIDL